MNTVRFYNEYAGGLIEQYNSIATEAVHRGWLNEHLPRTPGIACDIGAGSGRDANWLASRGWDVVAVEPSSEMRSLALQSSHASVTWLDDSLPELKKLRRLGHRFDLILLSAVWMHVPPTRRARAFRILSEMLKPSGVLVITLRHGCNESENMARGFHPVSSDELLTYSRQRALAITDVTREADSIRPHVEWETMVFSMPDDGTGNLPLLRHVIVNDDKSSSYKLGLLRVLTKIAEGSPGAVCSRTDEYVQIPLGLVALYWLKQYKPLLLKHKMPQHPNPRLGYGFAGDDFHALQEISDYDLRIGGRFSGPLAAIVIGAIRDAAKSISEMPVRYITYPGQNRPIFEAARSSVRKRSGPIVLSQPFFESFGVFRLPAPMWDTFGHYACWLEPAILREWAGLARSWGVSDYRSTEFGAFDWEEGRRDTSTAASRVSALKEAGSRVACVWSASYPRAPHIDHCFPWSRWFNNDLWNLVPASAVVNSRKGDKLPSAAMVVEARTRIIDWWDKAYLKSSLCERFLLEAGSSLPRLVEGELMLEDIFDALLHQRARLKADQQLVEWTLA